MGTREELYTNATIRYERAPDYLLMFPSRFASAREPQPGWKFGKGVNDSEFHVVNLTLTRNPHVALLTHESCAEGLRL